MSDGPPPPLWTKYVQLDAKLVSKGWPATSRFWRRAVQSFLRSKKRSLVIRAGRRAGKSSTFCRLAVLEALYGEHVITPGDTGVIVFLSVSKDEARSRLRTIDAILTALGVAHTTGKEQIDLDVKGRAIAFRVVAASVAATSGFTALACFADEMSKWTNDNGSANPAGEVMASLRPTMATQPNAHLYICSSPLSTVDYHYELFEQGDTDFQMVTHASTWEANPTISEADSHLLEPDPRIWEREYKATPLAAASAAFSPTAVARAFKPRDVEGMKKHRAIIVCDPSSGRKDNWTWAVARYVTEEQYWRRGDGSIITYPDGSPHVLPTYTGQKPSFLEVSQIDGVEGRFFETVSVEDIAKRVGDVAKRFNVTEIFADDREGFSLTGIFRSRGLRYTPIAWSATNKQLAVERVRRWLADGMLSLPKHEKLEAELARFEEKVLPSGGLSFGARGSGHDDYVALLITLALAEKHLENNPLVPPSFAGMRQERILYF